MISIRASPIICETVASWLLRMSCAFEHAGATTRMKPSVAVNRGRVFTSEKPQLVLGMPDSPHEVPNRGNVHDKGADTRDGHFLHYLIDLDGNEKRSRHNCQVLGPRRFVPQPDAFDHEESRIEQCANTDLLNSFRTVFAHLHQIVLNEGMLGCSRQSVDLSREYISCRG